MSEDYRPSPDQEHITIFEEYKRNNNIPPKDKTELAIFENAVSIVAAGIETTAYTLITAHYHLLANPKMATRLRAELREAWPNESRIPTWTALEKLPYLKAVLQESLRLSIGVSARLSRINHKSAMQYGDWIIPPHTAVSMSQRDIHYNPKIFPEPMKFAPDRWLQGEESRKLEKYLVSFSRGARGCIGI